MNQQSDRTKLLELQRSIRSRKGLVCCGAEFSVALHSRGRAVYTGADRYGQGEIAAEEGVLALACNSTGIIALLEDGTLRGKGFPSPHEPIRWLPYIRSVACSETHIAALSANGRVFMSAIGGGGQLYTEEWPAVVDVVCGRNFVAGVTEEGRVVVTGGSAYLRHTLRAWEDIAGIFADAEGETVYGITAEGCLCSTAHLPREVSKWEKPVFIAAAGKQIWGVTGTGQLLSTSPLARELRTKGSFVACAASAQHAVALTQDGLLFAVGNNDFGQCNTPSFGPLFRSFDDHNQDRNSRMVRTAEREKLYQSRLTEATRYRKHLLCGARLTACLTADERVLSTGRYGRAKSWSKVRALACGNAHLVALHDDGTVSADGNDTAGCTAVSDWSHIKSIAAGKYHTLGLTEEGRVLFCGQSSSIRQDVESWTGIRRLYSADDYAVGVDIHGRVLVAGEPPFPKDGIHERWYHPADLSVSNTHMVAVFENGDVRSTVMVPSSYKPGDGEVWDTCSWRSIRSAVAGNGFTVGLSYGGRVVTTCQGTAGGEDCDTSAWRDVVAIGCGNHYVAGLTADGRVLTARVAVDPRLAKAALPDTRQWSNVMTFACGPDHLAALNRSGQLLCGGSDSDRQCSSATHFVAFRDPSQLYGHGQYSRRLEQELLSYRSAKQPEPSLEEEQEILPFAQISSALREDTDRLIRRITGSDRHLTILDADGRTVTYFYDTAETVTEAEDGRQPVRMTASQEGTVLIYADGKARERRNALRKEPLSTLPNRLGDSHFYPVRDVADGSRHRVVLLQDGGLRAFGENDRGQGDVSGWSRIAAIAVGTDHTVGLRQDGTVVATGARHREAANRSRGVAHTPRANPCAVEDWQNVRQILCVGDVTLGLRWDGRVYAAGSGHYGQCRTEAWKRVVSVATSGNHTVALLEDGRVEAIGLNECGECRTESWRRVVQIVAMPELTLGLRADGRVLAAGRHHRVLETLRAVRGIACFGSRQVFVMADGSLRIHDRGSEYLPTPLEELRLFRPTVKDSILNRAAPHALPVLTARSALDGFAVGMAHTVTLGKGGGIHVNGANENGQCDVRSKQVAIQVAAGPYHTAVILENGQLMLSGRNPDGRSDFRALNSELGRIRVSVEEGRSPTAEHDPTVEDDGGEQLYAWRQVACGHEHTAALRSDGRVYAVGANPDGRCDTRKWRDVTELSCGVRHTVAVTKDATCVAVGDNRYGQCDLSLWKQITQVAAGEFHTVGLRADGRVEAAGDNRRGQCHVEDLQNIVSVACLPDATLCVHADGHVILRGGSGEHDKAVEALRDVIAIHTCEYRIAALTVDRRLIHIP